MLDREHWVEVIAIERRRGADAPYWLEDRINELLHAGEAKQADRLLKISHLLALLRTRSTLQ